MHINLIINNEECTFAIPFISARMMRKTFEVQKVFTNKKPDPDMMDVMIDFIVDLYGKQFTRDELYDGLEASLLFPVIMGHITYVMGELGTKLEGLNRPNV